MYLSLSLPLFLYLSIYTCMHLHACVSVHIIFYIGTQTDLACTSRKGYLASSSLDSKALNGPKPRWRNADQSRTVQEVRGM